MKNKSNHSYLFVVNNSPLRINYCQTVKTSVVEKNPISGKYKRDEKKLEAEREKKTLKTECFKDSDTKCSFLPF